MNTTQIQLKLSLSEQLNDLLQAKATRFGVPVTQFVKHLIMKEIEGEEYPTYQMSEKTEKKVKQALKEYRAGKSIKVDNVAEFFDNL